MEIKRYGASIIVLDYIDILCFALSDTLLKKPKWICISTGILMILLCWVILSMQSRSHCNLEGIDLAKCQTRLTNYKDTIIADSDQLTAQSE